MLPFVFSFCNELLNKNVSFVNRLYAVVSQCSWYHFTCVQSTDIQLKCRVLPLLRPLFIISVTEVSSFSHRPSTLAPSLVSTVALGIKQNTLWLVIIYRTIVGIVLSHPPIAVSATHTLSQFLAIEYIICKMHVMSFCASSVCWALPVPPWRQGLSDWLPHLSWSNRLVAQCEIDCNSSVCLISSSSVAHKNIVATRWLRSYIFTLELMLLNFST